MNENNFPKEEYNQIVFGEEGELYVRESAVEVSRESVEEANTENLLISNYEFVEWLFEQGAIDIDVNMKDIQERARNFFGDFILESIDLPRFTQDLGPAFSYNLLTVCVNKFVQYVIERNHFTNMRFSKDKILEDIHEFYTADDNTPGITDKFIDQYFGGSLPLLSNFLDYIDDLKIIFHGNHFDNEL